MAVAFKTIRDHVPFAKEDRIFSKDVEQIKKLILSRELLKNVETFTGELEL